MSVISYSSSRVTSPFGLSALMVGMFAVTGCSQPAETEAEVTPDAETTAPATGETIRIASEGAYPPFNYTEADGSLAGFDIDVVNALCEEMQANCEIVAQDWEGIIPGLMAGKYDAIAAGMSVTPERLEQVDFTDPYFKNTMVWVAKNDGSFDANNVSGKNLGSQRATSMGQYLQDNFDGKDGNTANLYDTQENAYLDLASGRVDAILAEKVQAASWLADNPEYGMIGDEIDNDDNIAIALKKDSPLLAQFNTALTAIKADGRYDAIAKSYFGEGNSSATASTVAATDADPTVTVVDDTNDSVVDTVDPVTVVEGDGSDVAETDLVIAEEANELDGTKAEEVTQ